MGRPWFWVAFIAMGFGIPLVSGLIRKRPADVPVLGVLPAFRLESASGGAITTGTVRGQVWVGLFVDPKCPACLARARDALSRLQRHTRNLGSAFRLLAICEEPTASEAWRQDLARAVRDPSLLWFACGRDGAQLEASVAEMVQGARLSSASALADGSTLLLVDEHSRLRGAYSSEAFEKSHLLGDITLVVNENFRH